MINLFGIYCTDEKAQDGTKFPVSVLEDMIWEGSNGRPMNITHDIHRFIGWNIITGLYISHEKSYIVGHSYIPDTSDEYEQLNLKRIGFLSTYQMEYINVHKNRFLEILQERGLTDIKATLVFNGIVMYRYDEILYKAYPDLRNNIDDDSLIKLEYLLTKFSYMGQGVFKDHNSDLAVMLHPYLRRGYSIQNNYNFGFLDLLWGLYNNGNKSIKILLDPNSIGYAPSYLHSCEYEYWYGPKYSDDIESIPQGLCRYENTDKYDYLFNNVKQTEFIWEKKKDGQYQFEMEEVVDSSPAGLPKDTYGCRYLHALYNVNTKEFNHFDGAIRSYDIEQMLARLDMPMDHAGHSATYQKIFRLDGHIPLGIWKNLITQYLISNPLVYEYFGLDRPFPKLESRKADANIDQMEKYVPVDIKEGDGVRILFSYLHDDIDIKAERQFIVDDEILIEKNIKLKAIEFATIEVYKALKRVGATIEYPYDAIIYKSEDNYNGIPRIHHSSESLDGNITKTLDGIKLLISQLASNNDDGIYSFSISWNMDDNHKIASISFMGHVNDLNIWLRSFETIPTDRSGLKLWLKEQNEFIHHNGRISYPPSSTCVMSDGILFFKRHDVQENSDITDIKYIEDKGIMMTSTSSDTYLIDLIHKNKISFSQRIIINHVIDKSNGENYIDTNTSAVFNETTYEVDYKLMGFNWCRH